MHSHSLLSSFHVSAMLGLRSSLYLLSHSLYSFRSFSLSPVSGMVGLHFPLHPFYHIFPDFCNAGSAFTLTRASIFFFFFGFFSSASVMLGPHFPLTPCIYFYFQVSLWRWLCAHFLTPCVIFLIVFICCSLIFVCNVGSTLSFSPFYTFFFISLCNGSSALTRPRSFFFFTSVCNGGFCSLLFTLCPAAPVLPSLCGPLQANFYLIFTPSQMESGLGGL